MGCEELSRILRESHCENVDFYIQLEDGRTLIQTDCGILKAVLSGNDVRIIGKWPFRVLRAIKIGGFDRVLFYEVEDLITHTRRLLTGRELFIEFERHNVEPDEDLIRRLLEEIKARNFREIDGYVCEGDELSVVITDYGIFVFMDVVAYERFLGGGNVKSKRDYECLGLIYEMGIGNRISFYRGFEDWNI